MCGRAGKVRVLLRAEGTGKVLFNAPLHMGVKTTIVSKRSINFVGLSYVEDPKNAGAMDPVDNGGSASPRALAHNTADPSGLALWP